MIQEKYREYTLSSYDPLTLTLPDFTVSQEDIAAEMERIAARHATNITINPHPIRADDMVQINIKTREQARVFPGLTHEDVDVQLGVGTLPEEIEVAMLGHEVGDIIEVEFDYTDYSQVASGHETPADGGCGTENTGEPENLHLTSVVEIVALRAFVIPEITDEWVDRNIALTKTVSEFRDKTKEKLLRQRRRKYVNDIEYVVMDEIMKRLESEPPKDAVNNVEKQMIREFDRFIEQYELDRASYLSIRGMDDFAFLDQIYRDARDRVAQDIALAAWATYYDISIDDEDIDFMFGEPTPERTYAARVEAEASGQIDVIKDLALRAKVARKLTYGATYVTSDGVEDTDFKMEIEMKYQKQQMVRAHATSDPMIKPPMIPVE